MKAEADRDDQVGVADTGPNSVGAVACAEADVATRPWTKAEVATTSLMEAVVERGNLKLAYQRVVATGVTRSPTRSPQPPRFGRTVPA